MSIFYHQLRSYKNTPRSTLITVHTVASRSRSVPIDSRSIYYRHAVRVLTCHMICNLILFGNPRISHVYCCLDFVPVRSLSRLKQMWVDPEQLGQILDFRSYLFRVLSNVSPDGAWQYAMKDRFEGPYQEKRIYRTNDSAFISRKNREVTVSDCVGCYSSGHLRKKTFTVERIFI